MVLSAVSSACLRALAKAAIGYPLTMIWLGIILILLFELSEDCNDFFSFLCFAVLIGIWARICYRTYQAGYEV
jgi:hypothetical protein